MDLEEHEVFAACDGDVARVRVPVRTAIGLFAEDAHRGRERGLGKLQRVALHDLAPT